jgi:hypothetical protein
MPPKSDPAKKEKSDPAITAAYIAGVFLLLSVVLAAIFPQIVPVVWGWLSGKQKSAVVDPIKPPDQQILSDADLKAAGCSSPKNGQCLACEKSIAFNNEKPGFPVDSLKCDHMPEDRDVRAKFNGHVVVNHTELASNNPQLKNDCFNTDVALRLGFTGSPPDAPQDNIHFVGPCPAFKIEASKKAPQVKAPEVELVLVTCQSGSTTDTCTTNSMPDTLRIEVIP